MNANVLCIEDHAGTQTELRNIFSTLTGKCNKPLVPDFSPTFHEGARKAVEHQYEAVILDIGLDDGDVSDGQITSLRRLCRCPIIILTGLGKKDADTLCELFLRAGADDCFQKEFIGLRPTVLVGDIYKAILREYGRKKLLE